jgi:glycerol kinase
VTDAHTAGPFIAAIDQGTTSSRCIVFDRDGRIVSVDQKEHEQIFPKPGWVEHNATEIWTNVQEVVASAITKAGITRDDIKAIGITNQRETTLLWDKNTGEPVHNAIVWQDTRTDALCKELGRNVGQDRFRRETGLPLASYFAGSQGPLAARQRRGPARARRGRRHPVRHHGQLGHLEPDGRCQRRQARHRRHQRLPHHADEPAHHGVGREDRRVHRRPAAMLPEIRSSAEVYGEVTGGRLGDLLGGIPSPPRSATSRRPCSARPVSPRARPSRRTAPAPSC